MSTAWISILLRHGADINRRTPNNKTALHFVCENGNSNVAALLLKWRADPSIKDNDQNTPLSIAKAINHKDLIKLLQNKSRDLSTKAKYAKYPRGMDIVKKLSTSRKRSIRADKSK